MEFKLTPFSESELKQEFDYVEFVERGYKMAMLNVVDFEFLSFSKTKYKFGLIDNDDNLHWFFYGKAVVKNRLKALQTYNALVVYCNKNNLGKPFAFKDFK